MPKRGKRHHKRYTLADHQFLIWWRLFVVERYPIHEKPEAWAAMMLSVYIQNRIKPFD